MALKFTEFSSTKISRPIPDYTGRPLHYAPHDAADYDPSKPKPECDEYGNEICFTKNCTENAVNFSHHCMAHGGKYGPSGMSRLKRFALGYISVEQLDDEELRDGCTRAADGTLRRKSLMTGDQYRAMVQELFKRHDDRLRGMLDDAITTMHQIMTGDAYEAADRIKAATWIFDRIRGKATENLQVTIDAKPFEKIFEGIARRGADGQGQALTNFIDAEVEEPEEFSDHGREIKPEEPRLNSGEVLAEDEDPESIAKTSNASSEVEDPELAERLAEERRARVQEAKEKIVKARNRRYAARSQGFDNAADARAKVLKNGRVIEPEDQKSPENKRRGNPDWIN